MADTLTIELTPETTGFIEEVVRSGEFPSPSAVVEAALHFLHAQRDELLGYSLEELRILGDEGEASGPGSLTLGEIQREALRRAGGPDAEA